ncbi:MAG: serine/threonine protein kinase [Gemmatimonadetes bacterium]|nr:serine/threonine protein kinase [Gemmatimonadota bacterium]
MSTTRWDRIAELFEGALALPAGEREAFLRGAANDDASLVDEVWAMLGVEGDAASLDVERRLLDTARDEVAAIPAGTQLGAWTIDEKIGHGGMGEVYRARRHAGEFDQVVALKVMRADVAGAEALRRFRSERAMLARLTHPHISAIIDGGTTSDGRPYLVMPFVEGGVSITRYCEERQLDLAARLGLFLTVADAVHHAHVRLVVHRDLKPSNILVGSDGRPVLLDFGIAKPLDAGSPEETRTEHRVLTPEHAAPEQVRGEPVSTATDVYGLGVLLYELIAGVRPFRRNALTPAALERAILEVEPPPPSVATIHRAERARVRGDLDRIVLMAMRKEPDRRYASAQQCAEDVQRWLARLPVRAQRDTLGYRTRRFVERNKVWVAAGAASLAVVVGAGLFANAQARARAVERDRARQEQAQAEDVVAVLTDLLKQSDPRLLPGGDTMRVAAFLDRAERQLNDLATQPERRLRLTRVLGEVRTSRGEYAQAESLLAAGLATATPALGRAHMEVLRARQALARTMSQGRGPMVALPLQDSVLGELRMARGLYDADVASAYLDIITATRDPDRARAMLDTVVLIRARLGAKPDSVAIATMLDAEATELRTRGRYREAEALYRTAVRILDRVLPRDHITRLSILGNLAVSELDLANWAAGDSIVGEIIGQVRRDSTGIEGMARSLELWASIHANLGLHARAQREERESISYLAQRLPSGHEMLDNSWRNLAIMMSGAGRPGPALALLDSVIERRRAAHDTASVAYMSAQRVPMLLRLGRPAEAARSVDALRALVSAVPPNSRWHADVALYHGMATFAGGHAAAAVPSLRRAAARYEVSYSDAHPRRAMARCLLGAALVASGQREEGAPLLVPACEVHERWGLADPSVIAWGREAAARKGG